MNVRLLSRGLGAGTVLAITLSVLGGMAGPSFEPAPVAETIVPSTAETAIGSSVQTAPVGTYQVVSEFHSIEIEDGISVTARVRLPVGAPEDLPAVVFVHGAGTADYLGFPQQAHDLASAGIVTVVPDKRMDTYTLFARDYVASAADYHHSVDLAQALPGVDPDRVGVYAESEGAYIAPVMAAEYDDVAFVALVSAPVVPGRQQAAYAAATYLANTGVPDVVYRAIPRAMGMDFPLGILEYGSFDPQPYQQQMTQPLFIAYGTADASMPAAEGTAQLIDDLAVAGNHQVTARFYSGANHGLKIGGMTGPLVDGFSSDLARWINGQPATAAAAPQIAGAPLSQPISAAPGAPAPWYQSGEILLASFLLPLAAIALGGASALVTGVRRGSILPSGLGRRLMSGVGLTLLTWGMYAVYLKNTAALAFSYGTNPGFTYGFLPLVNASAAAAAIAVGAAGVQWVDARRRGTPTRGFGTAATVLVGSGTVVLLAVAAYWGAFPDLFGTSAGIS